MLFAFGGKWISQEDKAQAFRASKPILFSTLLNLLPHKTIEAKKTAKIFSEKMRSDLARFTKHETAFIIHCVKQ